jgi:hypothetical protein
MYFREMGLEDVDWTDLDRERYRWLALVNTVMNLLVP